MLILMSSTEFTELMKETAGIVLVHMYGFVSLINYSIYDLSGNGLARETIVCLLADAVGSAIINRDQKILPSAMKSLATALLALVALISIAQQSTGKLLNIVKPFNSAESVIRVLAFPVIVSCPDENFGARDYVPTLHCQLGTFGSGDWGTLLC